MIACARRNLLATVLAVLSVFLKDYDRWVKVVREQNIKPQ